MRAAEKRKKKALQESSSPLRKIRGVKQFILTPPCGVSSGSNRKSHGWAKWKPLSWSIVFESHSLLSTFSSAPFKSLSSVASRRGIVFPWFLEASSFTSSEKYADFVFLSIALIAHWMPGCQLKELWPCPRLNESLYPNRSLHKHFLQANLVRLQSTLAFVRHSLPPCFVVPDFVPTLISFMGLKEKTSWKRSQLSWQV